MENPAGVGRASVGSEPEQRVMLGAPFSRPGKGLSPDLAAWKLPLV